MTVEEITTLAMQEMGKLPTGTTPTTAEYATGLTRLNTLIASLQNDNIFLALQDVKTITTVADQAEYVTAIDTLRVRGFSDSDINVVSRKEYDFGEDDANADRINIFIEYNYNPPIIQFMDAPTEAGTVYSYRRDKLVTELVSGQEPTLLRNAYEMLILGLAYKLCPGYGVAPQKRVEIKQDYLNELNSYRVSQSRRYGDEIVAPNFVV